MVTPNKNVLFSPNYAPELLKIAHGDLQSAKALMDSPQPGRPENILYMIQQAVEKALKASLIKKQIAFPMVHDLGILIALLPSSEYPPGGFDWTALNPFASIRRYEEGSLPVTHQEISAAYAAAKLVMDWAEKIIRTP